jgi:tricorn protease
MAVTRQRLPHGSKEIKLLLRREHADRPQGGVDQLLDGGTVFVPEFGTADENGKWIIEGHGVDPDIMVEQDPLQVIKGHDPQLERAVAELLQRLPAAAAGLPPRPAPPVKTGAP